MYMPLVAQEDGIPMFVKQAGVSLEPGDIIGILTLDDPSRVKHAKPFEGQLPDMGHPSIIGSKPHQHLAWDIDILNSILDGFDNQTVVNVTLKDLFEALRNPELPYVEAIAVLATLSGRMPSKLEESVRQAIDTAKSKSSHEFPAARVKKILDGYLNDLRPQDRPMARSSIQTLIDLAERYKYGLRAHEWNTIAALFARYVNIEKLFGGDIEQRVLKLREENKDDLEKVAQIVLSHIKAPSKNKLVLLLLDTVKDYGAAALRPEINLAGVLKDLAALENRSANPVSLKAREVLILCQMPSYDERSISMEAVLRASVTPATYGESTTRGYVFPPSCLLRKSDFYSTAIQTLKCSKS
jgi:acetyl-CoA carboxylase / biotin carboxylase 1